VETISRRIPCRNLASRRTLVAVTDRIIRFVGVYNAEGTLRGELSYWFGRRRGTAHCALCDITHGSVRERSDWRACRSDLGVPFDTYHLDDQPEAVRALTAGTAPVVVVETSVGHLVLLGPDELEACAADPSALVDRLRGAVAEAGLEWPA